MRCVTIPRAGGADVLTLVERPGPTPQTGQVLIDVRAAGLNRADIAQREGHYPAPPGTVPDIPGLEVAGVVAACAEGVTRWRVGDRVCALVAGGGYAEKVAVDAEHCLPVPEGLGLIEAAALPETCFTVWFNVFQRGELRPGETLLVHGGSSGIGTTAIQIATARGCRVFATAGSAAKVAACRELGAEQVIHYREQDFGVVLAESGCDVILDMVGGAYLQRNLELLRQDGRLVLINTMQGRTAEIDLLSLVARSLTVTGSGLRGRDAPFKASLARAVEEHVWPLLRDGRFRPVIDRVYPLAEAGEAQRRMESSRHIGKILLSMEA